MAYLFDTCALSELVAVKRDPRAVERIVQLPREELFLSVITVGEIQSGIDGLQPCARKAFLINWLENHILKEYADTTFPVDVTIARAWGVMCARLKKRGSRMQFRDSLIAATALHYGLTVITRNENDFSACGVSIYNPWTSTLGAS